MRATAPGGTFGVQFDLSPMNDLIQRIRNMAGDDFLQREIEGNIMPNVLRTLMQSVRSKTPVSQGRETSGLLRDAIAYKQVKYQGGRVIVGMVGVDRSVFSQSDRKSQQNKEAGYYQKGKRGKHKKGDLKRAERRVGEVYRVKIRPAKYFHLVEFGHKTRSRTGKRGEGTGFVAGTNFFRDAVDAGRKQVEDIVRDGLTAALQKLAADHLK